VLARGARLTELLKQSQFAPLKTESRSSSIYAGVNAISTRCRSVASGFRDGLLALVRKNHAGLLETIRNSKDLPMLRRELNSIVEAYQELRLTNT